MALDASALHTAIKNAAFTAAQGKGFANHGVGGIPNIEDFIDALAGAVASAVVAHLISNMEIKGVKTALDNGTRTIESYTAGVGSNTGSLTSVTGGPVSGSVKDAKLDVATQNNDGTGHVA